MKFYLGVHRAHWLALTDVPLFISRRILEGRKTLPEPIGSWALDSGGFTELSNGGRWRISVNDYISQVCRYQAEMPGLEWVAPMDYMCEPFVLEQTGLTVYEHQERTVSNFRRLRDELGALVIPVLQGWTRDEYLACWDEYAEQGVELADEPLVGVGSVCRRQSTHEAAMIFRALDGLNLHGFGLKKDGLYTYGECLVSADSMAWSADARQTPRRMRGHEHKTCQNCLDFALLWRSELLERLGQQRMEWV